MFNRNSLSVDLFKIALQILRRNFVVDNVQEARFKELSASFVRFDIKCLVYIALLVRTTETKFRNK